jgi:hypothetical protein
MGRGKSLEITVRVLLQYQRELPLLDRAKKMHLYRAKRWHTIRAAMHSQERRAIAKREVTLRLLLRTEETLVLYLKLQNRIHGRNLHSQTS